MTTSATSPARRYMRVTKTLRPQQAGTLKLARRYGDALLCVRYREDAGGQRRCTTVELIIDEGPVQRRLHQRSIVEVRLPWGDDHSELRARALKLGAWWDESSRAWQMSLRAAKALGLQHRDRRTAGRK
jgi:hypothetical protein